MKKVLLLLLGTSLFSTVRAADTTGRAKPAFVFSAEAGGTVLGVGNITLQDNRGSLLPAGNRQLNPTFVLRALRVSENGWGIGLRAEAARWHKSEDVYFGTSTTQIPTPGKMSFRFATPAYSLAPVVSKTFSRGRNEVSLALYGGFVYSPHKQESDLVRDPQTLYFISGYQHYPSSFGVQLGGELQYRYWLNAHWGLGATAGFQRNFMRLSETLGGNFTGYRLNTVPLTLGVSFRFN